MYNFNDIANVKFYNFHLLHYKHKFELMVPKLFISCIIKLSSIRRSKQKQIVQVVKIILVHNVTHNNIPSQN